MKDQFERAAAAKVFGAFLAFGVLGEPSRYVRRNSCIETAIRAAKQVDTPGRHAPLMPAVMRLKEAGCFFSNAAGLTGLGSRLPPQFGQTP